MITPSIYKIRQLGLGTLYLMPKPSREWLDEDITYFASIKITKIVSLLEEYEAFSLGLSEERLICNQKGIEFIQFQIEDRGVPDIKIFRALVTQLSLDLKNGENIAIHCRAGVGRAGLLSSCILKNCDIDVKRAIEEVSSARRITIPDTKEQYKYILDF